MGIQVELAQGCSVPVAVQALGQSFSSYKREWKKPKVCAGLSVQCPKYDIHVLFLLFDYHCWGGEWQTSESTKAKMHTVEDCPEEWGYPEVIPTHCTSTASCTALGILPALDADWRLARREGTLQARSVQYLCILNMFKFLVELIGAIHQWGVWGDVITK